MEQNNVLLKGKKIIHLDKEYAIDDLVTQEFIDYANSCISNYNNESCVVNELYVYYLQGYLAVDYFIDKNNIADIIIEGGEYPILAYVEDVAKKRKLTIKGKLPKWNLFVYKPKAYLNIIASLAYLLYNQIKVPYIGKSFSSSEFALIRYKSAAIKFQYFDFCKEKENIKDKDSIYKYFPLSQRIGWVLKSFVKSFGLYKEIMRFTKNYMGYYSSAYISDFYDKRVLHTCFYGHLIDSLFKNNINSTYYTASNLDRYSVIEDWTAEKYGVKIICIPHGIEYGFRFPKGFSSTVFYTTSEHAANFLNKLYKTEKFVFSEDVALKMFKREVPASSINNQKVVYFSEPWGKETNIAIIKYLKGKLEEDGKTLYLRLHPKDNREDYIPFGLNILDDFNDAICNNICIARKSTVLIEAIYNNSKASAILLNEYDKTVFNNFPSLQSEKIASFTDVDSLYRWIVQQYDK